MYNRPLYGIAQGNVVTARLDPRSNTASFSVNGALYVTVTGLECGADWGWLPRPRRKPDSVEGAPRRCVMVLLLAHHDRSLVCLGYLGHEPPSISPGIMALSKGVLLRPRLDGGSCFPIRCVVARLILATTFVSPRRATFIF